jgi:hypothetical protein
MKLFQSPCASRKQVLDEKNDKMFKLSNEGDYKKSITEEEYEYVRREFGYDLVPPSQYVPTHSAATDFDDDIDTQPSQIVEEPESEVSGSESDEEYVAEIPYEKKVPHEKPRARATPPEKHYRRPEPVDPRRSRKAPPVVDLPLPVQEPVRRKEKVREVHACDGLVIDRAPTAAGYHSENSEDDKSRHSRYDIDERSLAEDMHARPKSVLDSIRSDSSFDRRWRTRKQDKRRSKAVVDDDYLKQDSRPSRRSASRPAEVFRRDEVPDRRAHPSRVTTPVPEIRVVAEEQRQWEERQIREYNLYQQDRDVFEGRRAAEDSRRRSGSRSRSHLEDARVYPDPRPYKKAERSSQKDKKSRGFMGRVVASVAGRGKDKPDKRIPNAAPRDRAPVVANVDERDDYYSPHKRIPNAAPRDRVPVVADIDERDEYYSAGRRDQRKPREREQLRPRRSSSPFQLQPESLLSDVSYTYDPGSRVPIQYDDYKRETRNRKSSYGERARSQSQPLPYYGSYEDEYERVDPPKTPRSPAPPVGRHTPTRSHSFSDPAPPLRIFPEYTKRQVPVPQKLYHSSRLPARSTRGEQDLRRGGRPKQMIPSKKNSRGAYIVTGREYY